MCSILFKFKATKISITSNLLLSPVFFFPTKSCFLRFRFFSASRMPRVRKRQPFYWTELSHFGNKHTSVQLSQDTRFRKAYEKMPAEPEESEYEYEGEFFGFLWGDLNNFG
jgi:hypothetical protein